MDPRRRVASRGVARYEPFPTPRAGSRSGCWAGCWGWLSSHRGSSSSPVARTSSAQWWRRRSSAHPRSPSPSRTPQVRPSRRAPPRSADDGCCGSCRSLAPSADRWVRTVEVAGRASATMVSTRPQVAARRRRRLALPSRPQASRIAARRQEPAPRERSLVRSRCSPSPPSHSASASSRPSRRPSSTDVGGCWRSPVGPLRCGPGGTPRDRRGWLLVGGAVSGRYLAGLEEAQGTLAHVGELVGDDRVEAGLVEAELHEPTLRRLQVEHL